MPRLSLVPPVKRLPCFLVTALFAATPIAAQPVFNPGNGSDYECIDAYNIGWEQARSAAAARTFGGVSGFLATITSAEEQAFLDAYLADCTNTWIGASDDAHEGLWEWVTGPEAGTPFWSGGPKGLGGAPIDGAYENWIDGEPNNSLGAEDHAVWNKPGYSGRWNDHLRGPNPDPIFDIIAGYLVEYAGAVPLEVEVDIKPGSYPNSINPRSRGVIPVAILGSETFDATDIDVSTLAFGPGGASIAHLHGHLQDVNYDGIIDLVTHYQTQDTGIACGDESATLTGETLDGQSIEGTDSIQTVGCRGSGGRGL